MALFSNTPGTNFSRGQARTWRRGGRRTDFAPPRGLTSTGCCMNSRAFGALNAWARLLNKRYYMKTQRMRSALYVAVCSGVAALSLAGCGSTASADDEPSIIDSEDSSVASEASALSAPGALDVTFGNRGITTTLVEPVGADNLALKSDGSIVVVAALSDFQVASQVFGVLHYLPNGKLDTSFGQAGVTRTAFTTGFNAPSAVAVAPDGKIIVVGSASNPDDATVAFAIARYLPHGVLDATFGSHGLVMTSFLGHSDIADVVLLQPNGKILVGGRALTAFGRVGIPDSALARYNSDGSLDASFGQGGKVVGNIVGELKALALQADGSVLALGIDKAGTTAAARFSAAGAVLPVAPSGALTASAATGRWAFQPNGAFITAERALGISRFDIDAQLERFAFGKGVDASFNGPVFDYASHGIANRPSSVQALALQQDGKILAGGIGTTAVGMNALGLARFNTDGSFDSRFGSRGIVTTQFAGNADQIFALAVAHDGKIIAAGLKADSDGTSIVLVRYLGL
jgi:uncharacterized delta-60 repeat protein